MTNDHPKELDHMTMTTDDTTTRHSRNVWLPWKRVRRSPGKLGLLAKIDTASGRRAVLALSEDRHHPALYVHDEDSGDTVRIGLSTLVESVMGAEAREADRWRPLVQGGVSETGDELWGNELLTAQKRTNPDGSVILSYHWRDRAPVRDWRVGMRIKNELVGYEAEGVELYPADSRVMDEANEYWLFVFPEGHPAHEAFSGLGNPHRFVGTQDDGDRDARKHGRPETAVQRDDDGTVLR